MQLFDLWKPIDFKSTPLENILTAANERNDRSAIFAGSLGLEFCLDLIPHMDHKTALDWAKIGAEPLTEIEKDDEAASDSRHLCEIRYGLMRVRGCGLLDNREEGLGYIENSKNWIIIKAGQGHTYSEYSLGDMHRLGAGVAQSHSEAAKLYERAAAKNEICAKYNLAFCLLEGRGIPKNIKRAETLFDECIQNGHIGAQMTSASRFERERKWNDAFGLWTIAADRGSPFAQVAAGNLLANKDLGPLANPEDAFARYTQAENQGYTLGIYNVARCYEFGIGTGINFAEAYARYSRLFERKGETLETIGLSPSQLQIVQTRWNILDRLVTNVAETEGTDGAERKLLEFKDGSQLLLSSEEFAQRSARQQQSKRQSNRSAFPFRRVISKSPRK